MKTLFKELEELIPAPGQFLLLKVSDTDESQKMRHRSRSGTMLDIFKNQELAKKVYSMYAKSWNNAVSLIAEAELLYDNGYYARAIAIGITAWEELGKSQIAADYYSGVVPDSVYKEAFINHRVKTSYLVRMGAIGTESRIVANPVIGNKLEKIRQNALYVSESNEPKKVFTKDHAEFVLSKIKKHFDYICFAEEFNGRIGSKALFK